jgi:hypothetical protein
LKPLAVRAAQIPTPAAIDPNAHWLKIATFVLPFNGSDRPPCPEVTQITGECGVARGDETKVAARDQSACRTRSSCHPIRTAKGQTMATIHATPDERDPRHHTAKIEDMLNGVIAQAREDVSKVDDPHARALFETTAEVLTGLVRAYEHFDQNAGTAWR